jgi:sugar phosphate isomerase/epimerase
LTVSSVTDIPLGIFSRTYERNTLPEVLDAARADGFRLVHLNLKSSGVDPFATALTVEHCHQIRYELEVRGLSLTGVSCTFNAIHPEPERREQEICRGAELICLTPALGADFVSLSTGTRDADDMWRRHPSNDEADAWDDLRRTLERLLEAAHAVNITLGIEPESGNVVSSAERARRLLDDFGDPLLGIIFDAANLMTTATVVRQAEIVGDALELLSSDVRVVHAKDISDAGDCGAGLGLLDYNLLFEELERHAIHVPIVLHELTDSDVSRARSFVLNAASRAAAESRR